MIEFIFSITELLFNLINRLHRYWSPYQFIIVDDSSSRRPSVLRNRLFSSWIGDQDSGLELRRKALIHSRIIIQLALEGRIQWVTKNNCVRECWL